MIEGQFTDTDEFHLFPDWRPHFAEKAPRDLQAQVLDLVGNNWGKYRNFILELPTGVGKSAIAMTLARALYSGGGTVEFNSRTGAPIYQPHYSYITTTTTQLQDQYMGSFETQGLHKIYAADHFMCTRGKGLTCGDGGRICKAQDSNCPRQCPYKTAKADFIDAPFGIVNLAYYVNETYYAHQLPRRGLMIHDEGHTVGEGIADFVSLEISDKDLTHYLLKAPSPNSDWCYDVMKLRDWIESQYLSKVENYAQELSGKIDQWLGSYEDTRFLSLSKEHTKVDKHACRVRRIIKELNEDGWVAERVEEGIKMSPLRPTPFMKEIVTSLNDRNIIMSATILDGEFMAREYNLDPAETLTFSAQSPFPKENRPIYFYPVGKLDHNQLESTMKPFAEAISGLLDAHPGDRGIIFASSYAQVKELIRQVRNPRLVTHEGSIGKPAMMERHKRVSNSVIVSPSMHEGVDLKDDLSRFQIVLKLPFPSLGSKVVKKRNDVEPEWYNYLTCLDLIQATGRSVRSEEDHAVTYILDSSFGWFSSRWSRFLPKYWKEAITDA